MGATLAAGLWPAAIPGAGSRARTWQQGDVWGPGWRGGRFGGPGMGRGPDGQPGFMRRFAIVDDNGDDKIGADEAAAWRESVFAAMDADGNEELTMEEYMAVRMGSPEEGRNPQRQQMRQQQKQARFKPMDTDNSNTVSLAEWMAAGKTAFANADGDGDGVVTPWEFRVSRRNQ